MLTNFFNPKSIAVIGASEEKNKLGCAILKNLIDFKYGGKIYPINPKRQKILKLKTFPSVLDVQEKIDLAIIVIPSKIVPLVLKQCGRKKIKSVIIISAGFREIGDKGKELENKIIKIAKKHEIKILGPNCLGILDSTNNLNASFAGQMLQKGKISFISQSGAICCAALDWAEKMNIGFSRFVSLGNMTGLNEIDFLQFFKKDSKTKTIIAYLEQITDGKKFIKEASQITKTKPLIVIKSGETKEGRQAVSSHTGALAKSNEMTKFAFQQSGIIQANSLLELFDLIKFYSAEFSLNGPRIAILTNAGGPGAITVDAVKKNNLELANFQKKTVELLEKKLPVSASVKNPVDLIGDTKADRYKIALDILIKDKKNDAIIIILTPQSVTEVEKTAETIIELSKRTKKPILTSFIGGKNIKQANEFLSKANIPVYDYPEQAVKVLVKVWNYEKWKKENKSSAIKNIVLDKISKKSFNKIKRIIQEAKKENLKQLSVFDAEEILKIYQIPTVKSHLTKNFNEAIKISQRINQSVVLKISSPDVIHKTDAGGIKNNLKTPQEIKSAFNEIMKNVKKKFPKVKINGIIIQPMVQEQKEMILGIKQDELFGPFVMFGSGGIFAEVFKDISFRLSPLARKDAWEMIKETKAIKILKGTRGQKSANIEAIIKILLNLSALSQDFPEIKEVDINPLMAGEKKAIAVDARMMI